MDNIEFLEKLKHCEACEDGYKWIKERHLSLEESWDQFPDGFGMMWLAIVFKMRNTLVLVQHYYTISEFAITYFLKHDPKIENKIQHIKEHCESTTEEELQNMLEELHVIRTDIMNNIPVQNQSIVLEKLAELMRQLIPTPSYNE